MKQKLIIEAEAEGIRTLKAHESMLLPIKVVCTQCHDIYPNLIQLEPNEKYSLKNARGEANLILTCKNCKKDANIDIDNLLEYASEEKEPCLLVFTIATLECRGCRIIEFIPIGPYIINTVFEAELEDDWVDVLDNGECCSLLNLKGIVQ